MYIVIERYIIIKNIDAKFKVENDKFSLYCEDNLTILKQMEDNSVDSIVTDPPYGLSFMGKKWDYDVPNVEVWQECLRVLKPGGHLLCFAGTRTQHRMAVNIEDAGFEIRDMIAWVYGSGFPKSLNIGKAVDKLQGNEREDLGYNDNARTNIPDKDVYEAGIRGKEARLTKGNSPYEGWGTALKPALEPITLARKPLAEKTIAKNVLKYNTGGLNIDDCRVEVPNSEKESFANEWDREQSKSAELGGVAMGKRLMAKDLNEFRPEGRWPANLIHDGSEEVLEGFPETKSGQPGIMRKCINGGAAYGAESRLPRTHMTGFGDSGSASRFFYCAKASKKDRDEGCDLLPEVLTLRYSEKAQGPLPQQTPSKPVPQRNPHPTVKPTNLMTYLCKLITPKNGIVLDPFMGSGSTGKACMIEGFKFIGIDMEPEYFDIAKARITFEANKVKQDDLFSTVPLAPKKPKRGRKRKVVN